MNERNWAPLTALAISIGLIGAYLAFGGASYEPAAVADPCQTRESELLEARGTFEALALSALDGAACELQVPREELTLALGDEQATEEFATARGIDSERVEDAVRAGLIRAVDDAASAGRIDGFSEAALRGIAENAPVGAALEALQALPGDDSIQGLLGRLAELQNLELPGLGDLEDLEGLIP